MSSTVVGLVTNEGLSKSQIAALNVGWNIYPREFAFSANKGDFSTSRDYASIQPTWYRAPISARIIQSPNTIEMICTIPPGSTVGSMTVGEMYIIAKDNSGTDFLLGIGQADSGVITYDPAAQSKFRIMFTVANINISSLYTFNYTQATEVFDHNNDPNSHADIRALFAGGGNNTYRTVNSMGTQVGYEILADTTANSIVINLPTTNLVLGSKVSVIDVGGHVEDNGHELWVGRNTKTIKGLSSDYQIVKNYSRASFIWDTVANTWQVDLGGSSTSITGGSVTNIVNNEYSTPGTTYFVDSSANPVTVYLPNNFLVGGQSVEVWDTGSACEQAGHEIYVDRNGSTLMGLAENFQLDTNYGKARFVWDAGALTWQIDISSGGGSTSGTGLNWIDVTTATFNAIKDSVLLVDTSVSSVEITLPVVPSKGESLSIVDITNNCGNNNIIIKGNGELILGQNTDFIMNSNGMRVDLIYYGSTVGWSLTQSRSNYVTSNAYDYISMGGF